MTGYNVALRTRCDFPVFAQPHKHFSRVGFAVAGPNVDEVPPVHYSALKPEIR